MHFFNIAYVFGALSQDSGSGCAFCVNVANTSKLIDAGFEVTYEGGI